MRVFYTPRYYADSGHGHMFPIRKFELVLDECYQREVPAVTVMSGGYGENIWDTVEIHCNTIRTAKKLFESPQKVFSVGSSETRHR